MCSEEIDQWWTNLGACIPNPLRDWPIVLLADANAKIGADTCPSIGSHNAELGGEKALPFASFVRSNGLWLPSTFECHSGPSGTWQHHTGSWTRNDYVGLPTAWSLTGCSSWISEDIDVALHHEDHRAALVRTRMELTKTSSRRCRRPFKHFAETADLHQLRHCTPTAPDLDVHTHARRLQDQVVDCLPAQPPKGPVKLRVTMSESTWALVQTKRQCRKALKEANDHQRQLRLRLVLDAWKGVLNDELLHLETVPLRTATS